MKKSQALGAIAAVLIGNICCAEPPKPRIPEVYSRYVPSPDWINLWIENPDIIKKWNADIEYCSESSEIIVKKGESEFRETIHLPPGIELKITENDMIILSDLLKIKLPDSNLAAPYLCFISEKSSNSPIYGYIRRNILVSSDTEPKLQNIIDKMCRTIYWAEFVNNSSLHKISGQTYLLKGPNRLNEFLFSDLETSLLWRPETNTLHPYHGWPAKTSVIEWHPETQYIELELPDKKRVSLQMTPRNTNPNLSYHLIRN